MLNTTTKKEDVGNHFKNLGKKLGNIFVCTILYDKLNIFN